MATKSRLDELESKVRLLLDAQMTTTKSLERVKLRLAALETASNKNDVHTQAEGEDGATTAGGV